MLTLERNNRDYHHGNLRESSLLAARKLVSTKGLSALGLRKVASLAGVSPAALYRHFNNLEDLTFALSERIRDELGKKMLSVLPARRTTDLKSTIERLQALGLCYIEFAEANPKLFGVAFLNRDDSTIDEYTELAWNLLKSEISTLAETSKVSEFHLSALPSMLWSLVHGCASLIANSSLSQKEIESFKHCTVTGIELLARHSSLGSPQISFD